MQFPSGLNEFIGNPRAVEILRRAIAQDRLPHAMIFAGPPGVGKCTLALLIAQLLNCLEPAGDSACGRCSPCRRIWAIGESRHLKCLSQKAGYCGSCRNCKIRLARHPDVWLVEPEKTTISIEQVRALIDEIAFQPVEARYRVVIFDPAEQMRVEAHNSLLKTLEEPASRTVMILVTSNPYLLLGTIRSRCRLLEFGGIPQDRLERHLVERAQRKPAEARLAAALSGGSLSAALDFNSEKFRAVRSQALEFAALLLQQGPFAHASRIAADVGKEKDKEYFRVWLDALSAVFQDVYYAGISTARISQQDLLGTIEELARGVPRKRVVAIIHALAQLKRELQYNINRQLALEAMFLEQTA